MYEAHNRTSRAKRDDPGGVPQPVATLTDDEKKTKKQLVDELLSLRQRVGDLETFEAEHKAIATELPALLQRGLHLHRRPKL
jgi:hypothetical protein